jgi:peptidyl-prolyl cis-trans isomerase A (cyclophilin A)
MSCRAKSKSWLSILVTTCALLPGIAVATIVEFRTNMGDFQVNLYDNGTPQTVGNFLAYVNNGDYDSSISHRSVSNFVVQGGGFFFDPGTLALTAITANAPVVNEPEFANVRGTISMARPPGGVDTATNQWFINLTDNTGSLDTQDFAVFGEVIDNGMDVVDAIAALPTFPFQSPFGELPLANFDNDDFNAGVAPDATHLVIINVVVVTDATVDSAGAAGLNPPANTDVAAPPAPTPPAGGGGGGGGGGSFGLFGLLGLLVIYRRRRA